MFRHRIRDLMILNAVLAIALATVLALKVYTFVVVLVAMITIVPAAWLEIALYRRQKGTWYRWRHPAPPRPRYVQTVDSPPYPRVEPFPWAGQSVSGEPPPRRSRTRLFESPMPPKRSLVQRSSSRWPTGSNPRAASARP